MYHYLLEQLSVNRPQSHGPFKFVISDFHCINRNWFVEHLNVNNYVVLGNNMEALLWQYFCKKHTALILNMPFTSVMKKLSMNNNIFRIHKP